jgi:hypothetical protein
MKELQTRDHPHDKWRYAQLFKDDEQAELALRHLQAREETWRWRLTDIPDIFKSCTKEEKTEYPQLVRSSRYCPEYWQGRCARTKVPCVGFECEWFNGNRD